LKTNKTFIKKQRKKIKNQKNKYKKKGSRCTFWGSKEKRKENRTTIDKLSILHRHEPYQDKKDVMMLPTT